MKKTIAFILIPLVIIVTIIIIWSLNSTKYSLKSIGYNNEEISYIEKNLNEESVKKLMELEYDKNIITILKNKDYKIENVIQYINYINDDISVNTSIYLVNNNIDYKEMKNIIENENYNEELIAEYYNYKKTFNTNDEDTIYLINNNIDYKEGITELINEKYFLFNNLERYLNYPKNNLEYKSIVKLVNSNRDKTFYSDSVKTDLSKGYLVIVNKYYLLEKDYIPENLVALSSTYTDNYCRLEKTTYEAFKNLVDSAKKEGMKIICHSGYRSYADQNYIYNDYLSKNGLEWTNRYSAKPGFSEHQTGLAIDVRANTNNNYGQFIDTQEFQWMLNNAHKYGFILRYLENEENITGYSYEPWHYRYVGVEVATKIFEEKITYEEYYEYYVK